MTELTPQYGTRTVTILQVIFCFQMEGSAAYLVSKYQEDTKLLQHGALRNLFQMKDTAQS